jgi:hypothetical protein
MAEARSSDAPARRTADLLSFLVAIDRSPITFSEPMISALDAASGADQAMLHALHADNVDSEILEWIIAHARGKRHLTRSSH